jgi:hypothetical protein
MRIGDGVSGNRAARVGFGYGRRRRIEGLAVGGDNRLRIQADVGGVGAQVAAREQTAGNVAKALFSSARKTVGLIFVVWAMSSTDR